MIDMTIIIPTMNTTKDSNQDIKLGRAVKECLISLDKTTPKEIDIIVVSNGGDPKLLPIETSKRVKRVNIWGQGQCKAVNAGVAVTNSTWIMVTNDDMIYPPGWFEKLTDNGSFPFDCFSPVLVEPTDGSPTFIKYFCGGAGGDFDKYKFEKFVEEYEGNGFRTGFNLPFIIHRELWNTVGGYDINYDPWGSNSDSDLEYKIKLAGYQPMQNTNALVYHFSQTSGTFHPSKQSWWSKNWDYFKDKWGFERTDDGIWEADFEIDYKNLKYRPKWAVLPEEKPLKRP